MISTDYAINKSPQYSTAFHGKQKMMKRRGEPHIHEVPKGISTPMKHTQVSAFLRKMLHKTEEALLKFLNFKA